MSDSKALSIAIASAVKLEIQLLRLTVSARLWAGQNQEAPTDGLHGIFEPSE